MTKKMIILFTMILLSFSICGCSLDSLMANGSNQEVDKDKKYEKWYEGSTLPLENYIISTDATLNGNDVVVSRGSWKKKGITYFSISPWFTVYSKQGNYYLNADLWTYHTELKDTDELDEIYNSVMPDLSDVKVIDSSYKKTVTKDNIEYDIIKVKSSQYIIEILESNIEEENEHLGNDVDISEKTKEEEIEITLEVYVNAETGELWKIKYPVNGEDVTFDVNKLELPKELKGENIDNETWLNIFKNSFLQ